MRVTRTGANFRALLFDGIPEFVCYHGLTAPIATAPVSARRLSAGALAADEVAASQAAFWAEMGAPGLRQRARNNSRMLRQLQARADHLAESLLILELELRRSRTNSNGLQALEDLGTVISRIDALRRDAELLHAVEKDEILDRLDRKVARIMRSPAYRISEWFAVYGTQLVWHIGNETVDPLYPLRPC